MDETDHAETLDGGGPTIREAPRLAETMVSARIGRYPILRKLGEGGMGVVYAAYDDLLDRKLAIKLLRPRPGADPKRSVRLLREAQGLARLSDPNVVQIYEIGEHEGAVFMAMEFVAGRTLGDWLDHEPRSRKAILAAFVAAGRGLASAHAAKLIHRDFKPDNVMIADDGAVKVMDFGLVRAEDASAEAGDELEASADGHSPDELERSLSASQDSLGVDLTKTGSVMGTPAYMAPEQHFGRPADARSDQFSFCVALWEALYGARPFAGESIAAIAFNVCQGKISEPPAGADVPGWLRKVVERGLALEPDDRWPSIDALLAALTDDPTRGRRIWLSVLAVVVLIAAVVIGRREVERRAEAEARAARAEAIAACEDHRRAIDATWTEARAAAIAAVFERSKLAFARETWARTRSGIDDYAARWATQRVDVCMDAEVEGTLAPDIASRAIACFDEARAALDSLLDLLVEADDGGVIRALGSVADLPLIADCSDPERLARRQGPPEDPELRARVEDLRRRLARIRTLDSMGRYELATAEAAAAVTEAEAIAWDPLIAFARFVRGTAASSNGDYAGARADYEAALLSATRAGDDLLALDAAVSLVYTVGVGLDDPDDGLRIAELAAVMVERLGVAGTLVDARLHINLGAVHSRRDELDEALVAFERGLELNRELLSPAHVNISVALNNIGTIHGRQGRLDRALEAFERALALREASLPPGHPKFAAAYENIGMVYQIEGEYELAADMLGRALAIYEANLPPTHLDIAGACESLGNVEIQRGDPAAALALFQRVLDIRAPALPPDSPLLARSHNNLGQALENVGRPADALAHFALALEIAERRYEADDPRLRDRLYELGRVQFEAGDPREAVALLERALALAGDASALELAPVRWYLGRALWDVAPRRRAEARELIEVSTAAYREAGRASDVADGERWLATHGG